MKMSERKKFSFPSVYFCTYRKIRLKMHWPLKRGERERERERRKNGGRQKGSVIKKRQFQRFVATQSFVFGVGVGGGWVSLKECSCCTVTIEMEHQKELLFNNTYLPTAAARCQWYHEQGRCIITYRGHPLSTSTQSNPSWLV